jgi:hypothetical protein
MLALLFIAVAALLSFGLGFVASRNFWARLTLQRIRAELELPPV